MPTYDYQCSNCDHTFEEFQSITAKPLRKCSQCGKNTLKRLIGCGAGVIFKGSGFYETDYRSEGYKAAAKAEKEATSAKTDADKPKNADTTAKSSETTKSNKNPDAKNKTSA